MENITLTKPEQEGRPTAPPRIISVEDDADYRVVLRDLLAPRYELIQLSHGEGLAEEIAELRPDAVLMDLDLGTEDGAEVCRRLKAYPHMAKVPVLFVTGLKPDVAFKRALEVGAAGFLIKPVHPDELRERLRELVGA